MSEPGRVIWSGVCGEIWADLLFNAIVIGSGSVITEIGKVERGRIRAERFGRKERSICEDFVIWLFSPSAETIKN